LLNKRTAHSSYIKHTQEEALVLRDIVKHVKVNYPQDSLLESAFRYTKVIQDLLSHISRTCPSINNFDPKSVAVTPRKTDKKVRFAESLTSTENTKTDSTSNIVSNKRVLHSTGVRLSTSASGSQPSGNTKKDRILHRRLSHLNFGSINHLARHRLVRGLPKLKFEKDHLCSACALGKSSKKPHHKPKSEDTNQEKLYLLHMDLCGPMRFASVSGKKYILVIVNDYSRFTWVKCLRSKDEAPVFIITFLKMIQVRLKETVRHCMNIMRRLVSLMKHQLHALHSNGTEFVNQTLHEYYEKVGISHETSVARSPQQNGVRLPQPAIHKIVP
ncbi:retrovirus-related pol polyprotein from transposon TNT 1-94, partial [Tanacetum coccineum]